MKLKYIHLLIINLITLSLHAQTGNISGYVEIDNQKTEFVQIYLNNTNFNTTTNRQGYFKLSNIPFGKYKIIASYISAQETIKDIVVDKKETDLNFNIKNKNINLDNIVITGTKTIKRKTNSPVIVNIISSENLNNTQSCNIAEGLKFQPGLRVETNCQTCNYTQLRMNGLQGGYSQILINSRPIFSPMTGLYGMEQLPSNMIERIEIVRGAGSSLYGSSAIGGTVNIITKTPKKNNHELDYNFNIIEKESVDNNFNFNATLVSEKRNYGTSFFANRRKRDFFDANKDNFSEIPLIDIKSLGSNIFYIPKYNQKIELNLSYIKEYRFGGEMNQEIPVHLTKQAEERTHDIIMSSIDYEIKINNTSLTPYLAWQNTRREHYTGIMPEENTPEFDIFFKNPPYGTSNVSTLNMGFQVNHKLNNFLLGKNKITLCAEYIYDNVLDEIPAYQYIIDQKTKNLGLFAQSDWDINKKINILSGLRMDKHNFVENIILSPRVSLLYKKNKNIQLRLNYGKGFRAPQAFDTDLHITFAGGGISRITLDPDLKPELSQSISSSINYDKPMKKSIAGFTIECFYNKLTNSFVLTPIGQDIYGDLFEKQNGDLSVVKGITFETRYNYDKKIQIEGGYTIQSSEFNEPVIYIEGTEGINKFIRTPSNYGYSILTLNPNNKWMLNLNYIYTGSMQVPHFAGSNNQSEDEIITTDNFSELNIKLSYSFLMKKNKSNYEIYTGVKNLFNSYQNDFDVGRNRDSNYIYGPATPRVFYIGLKIK